MIFRSILYRYLLADASFYLGNVPTDDRICKNLTEAALRFHRGCRFPILRERLGFGGGASL
jgi:hypothetical protein